MTIRQTTLAAAFALAATLQGQVIDLGDVSAVAYFTVERATAFVSSPPSRKKTRTPCPCGVVAVLASGQSLTLSTPHEAGTSADAVEITRRADTMLVHKAAAAVTAAAVTN